MYAHEYRIVPVATGPLLPGAWVNVPLNAAGVIGGPLVQNVPGAEITLNVGAAGDYEVSFTLSAEVPQPQVPPMTPGTLSITCVATINGSPSAGGTLLPGCAAWSGIQGEVNSVGGVNSRRFTLTGTGLYQLADGDRVQLWCRNDSPPIEPAITATLAAGSFFIHRVG